jgi:CDP-glucose 4,6-dehydratase
VIEPQPWTGRRVLLTGHTGFKGAWLALWLERLGAVVTGFATPPPDGPSLYALARVGETLEHDLHGDVRDADAVAGAVRAARPDVVLHLAAQPLVRRALQAPQATYAINVLGTATLLEAVRHQSPDAAVVVVTSDKCYANDSGGLRRFREDDPLGGSDPYSASKAAQELVASSYRSAFGLRLASARAGNVIGGGDWSADRIVPDLVRGATAGTTVRIRHPAHVRPWQHVADCLSGYLLLAQQLSEGGSVAEPWNFGPDESGERPVSWLAERFGDCWPGRPLEIENAPADGHGGEAPPPASRPAITWWWTRSSCARPTRCPWWATRPRRASGWAGSRAGTSAPPSRSPRAGTPRSTRAPTRASWS